MHFFVQMKKYCVIQCDKQRLYRYGYTTFLFKKKKWSGSAWLLRYFFIHIFMKPGALLICWNIKSLKFTYQFFCIIHVNFIVLSGPNVEYYITTIDLFCWMGRLPFFKYERIYTPLPNYPILVHCDRQFSPRWVSKNEKKTQDTQKTKFGEYYYSNFLSLAYNSISLNGALWNESSCNILKMNVLCLCL